MSKVLKILTARVHCVNTRISKYMSLHKDICTIHIYVDRSGYSKTQSFSVFSARTPITIASEPTVRENSNLRFERHRNIFETGRN